MKEYKFYNLSTWDITLIKAKSKRLAIESFKMLKQIQTFSNKEYKIVEQNKVKKVQYSTMTMLQYENSLNRK